jgi:hypothetical protein
MRVGEFGGEIEAQIPFGNDSKKAKDKGRGKGKMQRQRPMQIPFGNDN